MHSQQCSELSPRRRQVLITSDMDLPGCRKKIPWDLKDSWNWEDIRAGARRTIIGAKKNIEDPSIFHKIALIPLLAWIGLGADGVSSSSYGPPEAFIALGEHTYLAIFLAIGYRIHRFYYFVCLYPHYRTLSQWRRGVYCRHPHDQPAGRCHFRKRTSHRLHADHHSLYCSVC